MNVLEAVRKKVVVNGRMRFGAQSRLAQLLGLSHAIVRRLILGDRPLTPEESATLKVALAEKKELFSMPASAKKCSKCSEEGYAKGLCRMHYYEAWKGNLSL